MNQTFYICTDEECSEIYRFVIEVFGGLELTYDNTIAAADVTLGTSDAVNVLEELLQAQNKSRFLGLKLNVPDHVITGIHSQYTDPTDRLYYVLVEFLKQDTLRPTWRAIVDALRSPAVDLPQLAKTVEAAHCPDPTSSRDVLPDTTTPTGILALTLENCYI